MDGLRDWNECALVIWLSTKEESSRQGQSSHRDRIWAFGPVTWQVWDCCIIA